MPVTVVYSLSNSIIVTPVIFEGCFSCALFNMLWLFTTETVSGMTRWSFQQGNEKLYFSICQNTYPHWHLHIYHGICCSCDWNMFAKLIVNKVGSKDAVFQQRTANLLNCFEKQVAFYEGLRTKEATARAETEPPSHCLHSATHLSAQRPDLIYTTSQCTQLCHL